MNVVWARIAKTGARIQTRILPPYWAIRTLCASKVKGEAVKQTSEHEHYNLRELKTKVSLFEQ